MEAWRGAAGFSVSLRRVPAKWVYGCFHLETARRGSAESYDRTAAAGVAVALLFTRENSHPVNARGRTSRSRRFRPFVFAELAKLETEGIFGEYVTAAAITLD